MVLGRRRFVWRDDVRGVVTVAVLGILSIAALVAVLGAILVLVGDGRSGTP
jgi:hypothetical protein